jgi:hypothetical protein
MATSKKSAAAVIAVYALASTMGGAATGAMLGMLASQLAALPAGLRMFVTIGLLGLGAYATWLQAQRRVRPLPQRHNQVPRRWTLWRNRLRLAAAFGFLLGTGVATWLHHATAYVVAVAVVMTGSFTASALIGSLYGITRAVALMHQQLERSGRTRLQTEVLWERAARLLPAGASVVLVIAAITTISL